MTEAQKTAIMVSAGKYGDYVAVLDSGKCTVFDFTTGSADGFYPLCKELLARGVTRADYVLAAEPSSRHLQSIIRVCSYFDIDDIYAPADIADGLSAFCGKSVIKTDGAAEKYKNALLEKDGGELFLSVGDAAYVSGLKDKNVMVIL